MERMIAVRLFRTGFSSVTDTGLVRAFKVKEGGLDGWTTKAL